MKKIKILTSVLAIILVTMVAVFGVYVEAQNRMENTVKGYSYAMDLKGVRSISLKVDTTTKEVIKDKDGNVIENATDEEIQENGYTKEEVPNNSQDVLNIENYKKTKEIIEKRLKALDVQNYIVKLNEQTGEIFVEITENSDTDLVVSNINTVGKFEIIDTETKEVLMDNQDISLANVMYGNNSGTYSSGTSIYLNIEFNKEGRKKLEEISNKYAKVEETENEDNGEVTENTEITENTEETSESEETKEKTITMKIDDEEILSTSFDEPIKTGKIQLSIGSASTDTKTIKENVNQATNIATILDNGNMPIKYELGENEYVASEITKENLQFISMLVAAIIVIALIVWIIRFKSYGFLSAISYIGLISIFLLIIRYTNVVLSIEGIFGIILVAILNYIFINKLLFTIKKNKEEKISTLDIQNATKETYKDFFIKIIPVCIAVITFSFIKWIPISSFGMTMFWGIALIALYNFIITSNILKIRTEK